MKEIVIFGTGKMGMQAYEALKEKYTIVAFVDNDKNKWGTQIDNIPIYSPDELVSMKKVQVIIASIYYPAMYKQLEEMGITDIRIFQYCEGEDNKTCRQYSLFQIPEIEVFRNCKIEKEKIRSEISPKNKRNESEKKKVLFCTYYFPPKGGSGVQRSLKFVKYLRKYGYEPIVLTSFTEKTYFVKDTSLLDEIDKDIKIIELGNAAPIIEMLSAEQQQLLFNLYGDIVQDREWLNLFRKQYESTDIKKRVCIPDDSILWVAECIEQLDTSIDMSDIDIVYTTGDPFSTYMLGYYIKKRYGIPWVQDYRDPWTSNDYFWQVWGRKKETVYDLQEKLEKALAKESDIIVTAVAIKDELANKYGVNIEKIYEIHNGYDEADFSDFNTVNKENDKFTMCYNGMLHMERNPIYLLQVINDCIQEGKIDCDKIQWIFNGELAEKWEKALETEDTYHIVKKNGYLKHRDSLISAMQSDVLVLFSETGPGSKVFYTGKVYEYLRMKTPIISFSERDGLLTGLLEETKTGLNFSYDDCDGMKKYLLSLYQAWMEDNALFNGEWEEIQKYSRENATKQLAELFDKCLV